MSQETVGRLISDIAEAVRRQRVVLETEDLERLAEVTQDLEAVYRKLEMFEGGLDGVRVAIEALPQTERDPLREAMTRTAVDLGVAGDLIRIATRRVAALQSFQAASSIASTYGASPSSAGTRVSRRA
jgi:hypothetical protein